MSKLTLVVVSMVLLSAAGCAFPIISAPVVPASGIFYTNYRVPLDTDFDKTQVGSKSGEATCVNILGLVSVGDAGTKAAAANGRITTIRSADYEYFNILGLFSQYKTIVYGD